MTNSHIPSGPHDETASAAASDSQVEEPVSRQPRWYVTTAIPYVNARPHIGFALEFVLTDALARFHRLRGEDVRFLTGTDENSLKNVQAAEREGIPTAASSSTRNAEYFAALREPLSLSFDDFIRTSAERAPPRRACASSGRPATRSGDIYTKPYRGLYCVGCEQFYTEDELVDGLCPEHLTRPEVVEEENYFFRLSRYADQLLRAHRVRRSCASCRRRARTRCSSFIRRGLADFSISRSQRARPRLGHPRAGRPGSGDVRLVRRAGQLHHRAGLRRRRSALPALLGARIRIAST